MPATRVQSQALPSSQLARSELGGFPKLVLLPAVSAQAGELGGNGRTPWALLEISLVLSTEL